MSDGVYCDVCGKKGRRRLMRHCPEGWFYGEVGDDGDEFDGEHVPDKRILVIVCSVACKERFWCAGPGQLSTEPDYVKERKQKMEADG